MRYNRQMLIVFTTVPKGEESEALAEAIVNAKLAACVQILPPMSSIYIWDGEVQQDTERLLLIKTLPDKYPELEAFITANHSYEVPEIIAIEAAECSTPYLQWLQQVTANT